VDLLEAEFYRILKFPYQAMDYYDRAIDGAIANGYIQDAAIANERAAQLYLSIGKTKNAAVYLQAARKQYQNWGAAAKVKQLETLYSEEFSRSNFVRTRYSQRIDPTITHVKLTTTHNSTAFLDFATAMKASEAIASELVLDKLLNQFLQIILENSGAQKGCIILDREGELYIEVADFNQESMDVIPCNLVLELQESPVVCAPLIRYVARTRQPIVVEQALSDPMFALDPYVLRTQPKSILCTPIVCQGKGLGFMYLENNLVPGAFTSDRLALLNILTSQAAIAIENAKLYALERQRVMQIEQSQAQLVQSEKMSALGNLVAGVAHEINNPIGFLHGSIKNAQDYANDLLEHLEYYQQHYPEPVEKIQNHAESIELEFLREDFPKLLNSMQSATDRMTGISTSLRTFSRADTEYKIAANLHDGIASTLLILKYRLKANQFRPEIEIITDYGNLPDLKCFPGQLNQVFMNLLANAIDVFDEMAQTQSYASIEANRQRIMIVTRVNKKSVQIKIEDNGKGMTESVKEKIFDHLFTTKEVGKGTGLGLSIARQIIAEKHGGALSVESIVGQGTTFTIILPMA
jgi:signal transduction histidine kinase